MEGNDVWLASSRFECSSRALDLGHRSFLCKAIEMPGYMRLNCTFKACGFQAPEAAMASFGKLQA